MDDADKERLNSEIDELKKDSTTWKSMELENIQLMNDTLKIIKEKSTKITKIQGDFIKDLERTSIFYLEISPISFQGFKLNMI
mgnify:CR=1 FL=1